MTSAEPQPCVVGGLCPSFQVQALTQLSSYPCSLYPSVLPFLHPMDIPTPPSLSFLPSLCPPELGSPAADFSSGSLGPERGRKVRPEVGPCVLRGPGGLLKG